MDHIHRRVFPKIENHWRWEKSYLPLPFKKIIKMNQERIAWLKNQIVLYEQKKKQVQFPAFMDSAIQVYQELLKKELKNQEVIKNA